MKKSRGYAIIEPEIYEELNWNMDMIMSCLEVIRRRMPELFSELPKSVQYELIPYGNPFGEPYPVIGIYSDIAADQKKIPGFIDLYERVENWLNKIEIATIKEEAQSIKVIDLEVLKNRKIG